MRRAAQAAERVFDMSKTWKEVLTGKMPDDLAREVEIFETQIELRKQGKMDEKIFAETRLRRGAYGQRYDNGRRRKFRCEI